MVAVAKRVVEGGGGVLGERAGQALDVGLVGVVLCVVAAGVAELTQGVAGGERREGEGEEDVRGGRGEAGD
jgi:hypothetical protein